MIERTLSFLSLLQESHNPTSLPNVEHGIAQHGSLPHSHLTMIVHHGLVNTGFSLHRYIFFFKLEKTWKQFGSLFHFLNYQLLIYNAEFMRCYHINFPFSSYWVMEVDHRRSYYEKEKQREKLQAMKLSLNSYMCGKDIFFMLKQLIVQAFQKKKVPKRVIFKKIFPSLLLEGHCHEKLRESQSFI